VEWLKVKALSSNPSTKKKKRDSYVSDYIDIFLRRLENRLDLGMIC
jgi:hypothetical protein